MMNIGWLWNNVPLDWWIATSNATRAYFMY
jgi:hypothetical protein